jgi:hypothetical protein
MGNDLRPYCFDRRFSVEVHAQSVLILKQTRATATDLTTRLHPDLLAPGFVVNKPQTTPNTHPIYLLLCVFVFISILDLLVKSRIMKYTSAVAAAALLGSTSPGVHKMKLKKIPLSEQLVCDHISEHNLGSSCQSTNGKPARQQRRKRS